MTSSFSNLVGTERDEIPKLPVSNYASTEANMEEAVNKQIDENIKDQELLNNYASKSKNAVDKYKGIFLVRGGNKITTEGKEFVRTVVIEFETLDIAKDFFYSEEYQAAHAILANSVIRNHQIIEGT